MPKKGIFRFERQTALADKVSRHHHEHFPVFGIKIHAYKKISWVSVFSLLHCLHYMDDLGTTSIKQLGYTPLFYYRHVDDIILCIPQDKIECTLNIFNNYHQKLQFTIETEDNNKINFLDVTLIKKTQ